MYRLVTYKYYPYKRTRTVIENLNILTKISNNIVKFWFRKKLFLKQFRDMDFSLRPACREICSASFGLVQSLIGSIWTLNLKKKILEYSPGPPWAPMAMGPHAPGPPMGPPWTFAGHKSSSYSSYEHDIDTNRIIIKNSKILKVSNLCNKLSEIGL